MKQFITAWVIGLLVVLFISHEQKDVPHPRLSIQKVIVSEPILSTKEFPYSVVRGGVHNANEAQDATDDEVVKLHYAGIDTRRLEATAFQTNALRYVSYRVSDRIFWTAKRVTIKAGEPVLCDGRNFIRARCGNRISEHPMQPTRQIEPSEAELDTPVPEYSESSIAPPLLANMFTSSSLDETSLIEQPSEQAASSATLGLGGSPGGYMIPPLAQPLVMAFVPPGLPFLGSPIIPGVVPPEPVAPPGAPVVPPVAPPVVPPAAPPVSPPVAPPVGPPVAPPVSPPVAPPVGPPVAPPVGPPVAPPVSPPVAPPVSPPVAPPVGPPVAPPVGPPVAPPVGPPVVPPEGPLGPPVNPPVGPPIEPPIEPPIMPPISPPPSITPEPNSFVLFGGVLVLGIAIARIKMLRDGRRKHGVRRKTS